MRKIKLILFLIMVFSLSSELKAKKLKIYRCVQNNGTIAFQEKRCSKSPDISTVKPALKNPKNTATKSKSLNNTKPNDSEYSKPKYREPRNIKYQKNTSVSLNDKSTLLITGRAKSFDISLRGLKKWSHFKKIYNNKLLHVKYKDDQVDEEISLRIDFIFPDNKRFSDQELTELVYLVGSQYVKTSREGAVLAENMNISNGNGIMATFTDMNNLEHYRYTTRGAVFKGKWLIQFTLLSSNLSSYSFQYAVQDLFNSIQITQ